MVVGYRNTHSLSNQKWYLLELSDDGRERVESAPLEQAIRRLLKAIPSIFGEDPCEVFIPVLDRDLDIFELASGPFLYVRGNFNKLLKLKKIHGFLGLYTASETGYASHAVPCEDSYVQQVIALCEQTFNERCAGIKQGSVVRLLDGETRDYVGEVLEINEGFAKVRVKLYSKELHIKTPIGNCRKLNINNSLFYYTPQFSS